MTKASFSSTRAAGIDARKRVEAFQWSVMVFLLCRPVVRTWLAQAALAGSVPGLAVDIYRRERGSLNAVRWMPPPWASADPEKDAKTNAMLVESRFIARSDVIEANGFDAEETDQRIAADQERERRLGIMPPAPAAAPRVAPPTDPDDQDDAPKPVEPEE
jgi:capsid protein